MAPFHRLMVLRACSASTASGGICPWRSRDSMARLAVSQISSYFSPVQNWVSPGRTPIRTIALMT